MNELLDRNLLAQQYFSCSRSFFNTGKFSEICLGIQLSHINKEQRIIPTDLHIWTHELTRILICYKNTKVELHLSRTFEQCIIICILVMLRELSQGHQVYELYLDNLLSTMCRSFIIATLYFFLWGRHSTNLIQVGLFFFFSNSI